MQGGQMQCSNCGKPFDDNSGYGLEDWDSIDTRWSLCSIACLTEFAWKLRERLPKLSKSRTA